jgi:hypothetical protein
MLIMDNSSLSGFVLALIFIDNYYCFQLREWLTCCM